MNNKPHQIILFFRNCYVYNDKKVTFYFNNKNATFRIMKYYILLKNRFPFLSVSFLSQ